MQETLIQNLWVQFGALGLLTASGWLVAWVLWKDNVRKNDLIIDLTKKTIQIAEDDKFLKQTLVDRIPKDMGAKLDSIAEGLNVQELVRELMRQHGNS